MPNSSSSKDAGPIDTFGVIGYFIVLTLLGSWYSYSSLNFSFGLTVTLMLLGLFAFTLTEYLIHRYILHWSIWYAREDWSHTGHHQHPLEREHFDINLPQALLLSVLFFGLFWLIARSYAVPFFAGFALGYAIYHYLHYIIHTRRSPRNVLRHLWANHHIHHHLDEHAAYGVTSPFWDWVFGTLPHKGTRKDLKGSEHQA